MIGIEQLESINTNLIGLSNQLTEAQRLILSDDYGERLQARKKYGKARKILADLFHTATTNDFLTLTLYTGRQSIEGYEVIAPRPFDINDVEHTLPDAISANSFIEVTALQGKVEDFMVGNEQTKFKIGTIARMFANGGQLFVTDTSSVDSDEPSVNA